MDDRAGKSGMSEQTPILSTGSALVDRWQIPTLIAGLLVFTASMTRLVREQPKVRLAEEWALISRLRDVRAEQRAAAYISSQMQKPHRPANEPGGLVRQPAGGIHHP